MAKQYQEQNQNEYSDLDFEEVEEETQSKKYHFSVKGYIKKVCITGVILGLMGYAGSAIINGNTFICIKTIIKSINNG